MDAPRRYTVSDGLMAGAYRTQAAVEALERAGVTVFVDLTHPSDPLDAYERHLVGDGAGGADSRHGTSTEGQLIRILDSSTTRASVAAPSTSTVGWGRRTGTVVGCWLVRHGLDRGDTVADIAALRAGLPGAIPSPETAAQVAPRSGAGGPDGEDAVAPAAAKSSWDDPALSDHDRPLAPRGQGEADPALGRRPSRRPDLVLCLTAARAEANARARPAWARIPGRAARGRPLPRVRRLPARPATGARVPPRRRPPDRPQPGSARPRARARPAGP